MKMLLALSMILMPHMGFADPSIVTCPEWRSKQKLYVEHSKKSELLKEDAPKGFIDLYRAMAAIMGSKRMSPDLNEALEKSGYADIFDTLMAMNYRGGLPDDFIDAVKRFHGSKKINLDDETYVIDVSNQEMLSKFRYSYCK